MGFLRGWSLFYRLVAVSAVAAAAMTIFALWVTTEHIVDRPGGGHWDVAVPLMLAGLAITLALVFAITRVVLRPIAELEENIVSFGQGDLSARAHRYRFTDVQLTRLILAFNEMADSLVEKQAKLTEMSSRVIAAQEEERRRLAREIHDDAGQNLTTALLILRRLESSDSLEEVRGAIPALRDRLGATLDGLRRLARTLRPSVLDDLGLAAAIRSSVNDFEKVTPVKVELALDGLDGRLSSDAEIVLYRVFQEAMINVAKHAHASTARVQAKRNGRVLRLSVEDDGVGFDASAQNLRERGVGLFSMAERLALIGGVLRVKSALAGGSTIIAEVPIDERS
jgi:two-component system sensor histidine kinase UhpB